MNGLSEPWIYADVYRVSVWKPLKAVHDFPLAVCDYRTVAVEDLVPTDIVFPDYLGETYNFRPNPSHRWYYIDEQAADEAWMVKCFDSATNHDPNIASCMIMNSYSDL